MVRVRQTAFSRRRSGQLLAEMKGGLGLVYAEVLTDSRRSDDVVTLKHLQVDSLHIGLSANARCSFQMF